MLAFWRVHRRTLRLARAMLAVWLFALASGWANACVPRQDEPSLGAGHDGRGHGVAAHAPGHGAIGPAGSFEAHEPHEPAGHDAHAARLLCQSVCDDERSALPKVSAPSLPDFAAAPLVPIEAWSYGAVQAQSSGGRPLAAAPPPEPAVAIRFLRLTL